MTTLPAQTSNWRDSRPRRAILSTSILLLLGSLAACATPTDNDTRSATAGLPDLRQTLAAHVWLLDRADSSPRTQTVNRVTLVFGDDIVFGDAACNTYRGRFSADDDDDTVQISDIRLSSRSCAPRTERAEREFFRALRRVRDVDFRDDYDRLVLTGAPRERLAFDATEGADRSQAG